MPTPSIPDWESMNFALGDKIEAIEKQNAQNEALKTFSAELVQYVEESAEALLTAGGAIFPTISAGMAAADIDGYFYAENPDPDISKTLYQKLSVSDYRKVADDPSAEFVERLQNLQLEQGEVTSQFSLKYLKGMGLVVVDASGRPGMSLSEMGALLVKSLNTENSELTSEGHIPGVAFTIKSKDGGVALSISEKGDVSVNKLFANEIVSENEGGISFQANSNDQYMREGELLTYNADLSKVAVWGSSSAQLSEGALSSVFSEFGATSYYQGGRSGEASDHISARIGSIPAIVNFPNDEIPASSGDVNVTSDNLVSRRMSSFSGSVMGVNGTLRAMADGQLIFNRINSGQSVQTAGPVEFIPNSEPLRAAVTLLWMGKGDINRPNDYDISGIIDRTDRAFNYLSPMIIRCMVLGHFSNRSWTPGDVYFQRMNAVNAAHKKRYGDLYIDVQALLMSEDIWDELSLTPSEQDLLDQSQGIVPEQLTRDASHLSVAGYEYIATHVRQKIIQLEWYG